MNIIGLLLDIGNIIFTIGSLPQIYRSFRYRENLKGLDPWTLIAYSIATVVFLPTMVLTKCFVSLWMWYI